MEFVKFDLEPNIISQSNLSCANDYVIVRGPYQERTAICNSNKHWALELYEDENQLRIYFYSNKQNQFNGFEAVFYAYGE